MRDAKFKPFAVGQYRCDGRLRAGGIGDLFLAVHVPTGSRCTLWSLSPDLLEDTKSAETLLKVQLRAKALAHPNIARVREVLRKDSQIYVATEYQSGISLHHLLLRLREVGSLSPPVASFVVWQICQALDHAHHLKLNGQPAPLIHGAICPQSVTVSFGGEVRLFDFGTWLIPTGAYRDDEISVRTNYSYRAPEHLTGATLTRATDLFCVGILLYEMLTARSLFLAPTLTETAQRVEHAELGSMIGVPQNLQPVLRRCMARQPRERYPEVAAFIAELSQVVAGLGDRAVKQELVRFLTGHFVASESSEPRPAPLPGQEEDETTNISPADLTEVLLALSRERTNPDHHLRVQARVSASDQSPARDWRRVELLAPESIDDATAPDRSELGDDASTSVQDAPPVLPGFEDECVTPIEVPRELSHRTAPVPQLFPPPERDVRSGRTGDGSFDAEESTVKGSPRDQTEEEEAITAVKSPALAGEAAPILVERRSPPVGTSNGRMLRAGDSCEQSVATVPLRMKPSLSGGLPAAVSGGQALEGRIGSTSATGPSRRQWPGLSAQELCPEDTTLPPYPDDEALGYPGVLDSGLAAQERSATAATGTREASSSGLFFEKHEVTPTVEEVEPAAPSFDPSAGTPISAFDPDAFSSAYSESFHRYQKRSRLSPALIMFSVASLVFLAAVAMLARRMWMQRAAELPRQAGSDSRALRPDRGTMVSPRPSQATRSHSHRASELPAGTLRVETQPVRAEVYAAGKLRGTTPVTIPAKPGDVLDITLVASGYDILRKRAWLPAEQGLLLNQTLARSVYPKPVSPPFGVLRVRCRGRGLHHRRVYVDDEDTGLPCDSLDLRLRAGVHRVHLYSVERDHTAKYRVRVKKRKSTYLFIRSNKRLP